MSIKQFKFQGVFYINVGGGFTYPHGVGQPGLLFRDVMGLTIRTDPGDDARLDWRIVRPRIRPVDVSSHAEAFTPCKK